MDRIPVESSNVAEVGYDEDSMIMEVAFLSGGVYQYLGVPKHIHNMMMAAPSKGRFLHEQVKNVFAAVKTAENFIPASDPTDLKQVKQEQKEERRSRRHRKRRTRGSFQG